MRCGRASVGSENAVHSCAMRDAIDRLTMRDLEESSLARLTIPDALTPEQFYDGVRKQHPEMHGMKRQAI